MHEAGCSEEAIHALYKARVLFPPPSCQVEMSQDSDGAQNSQSSSTDLIAQSNFSRRVFEKKRSMGTSNFLEKTTVRRGSM